MVNEWTVDDLPSAGGLAHTYAAAPGDIIERFEAIVDELVWHLNTNHPKPDGTFAVMLEDTHRAQRAWAAALRKRGDAFDRAVRAERERDAAVARAEKAERDRDEADRRTAAAEADRDRWKLHHDRVDGQWAKAEREVTRLRGTGSVSRADIEKVLVTGIRGTTDEDLIDPDSDLPAGECVRLAIDAVCDLFGVEAGQAADPDPVEERARDLWESTRSEGAEVARWEEAHEFAQDQFRILARHVLGQEDRHADQ